MPSDNTEVMDDFIVDMDIETITLDDLELKDSSSAAESLSTGESDSSGLTFEDSVQIDEINLSTMSFSPENVETVQVSGPADISMNTSSASFTAPVETMNTNITAESFDIAAASFEGPMTVSTSSAPGAAAMAGSAPASSSFAINSAPTSSAVSGAGTDAGYSETSLDMPGFDVPDLSLTPDSIEENYTTGSVTAPVAESAGAFTAELDQSDLDVVKSAQEPSIPSEPAFSTPEASSSTRSAVEASPIFDAEDDIISIDGRELDKIIYGESSELSAPAGKGPMINQPVVVGTVPVMETEAVELTDSMIMEPAEEENQILINTDTMTEVPAMDEIPMPEETISTEEPFSELETQTSSPELVLAEDNGEQLTFDNTTDGILTQETINETDSGSPIQASTQEISIDGSEAATSPEFSFDLSVIPDVAEIEEDEPIALSMDELNNIDISEGNVIEFPAPDARHDTDAQDMLEEEIQISENHLDQMAEAAGQEIPEIPEFEMTPAAVSDTASPATAAAPVSLDELNDMQRDISADQPVVNKEKVINEKIEQLSTDTKDELKSVLLYLDTMLEDLPEERIRQFAKSEYYDLYVKILDKLGI